ncbi:DUF4160 domain-containing protein, partial [bacterium]|nr:DUF4160 domain-containing protein [bacterium]
MICRKFYVFTVSKFLFFSNESHEPVHVHVKKGHGAAKFWLNPLIELDYSEGFNPKELKTIRWI